MGDIHAEALGLAVGGGQYPRTSQLRGFGPGYAMGRDAKT